MSIESALSQIPDKIRGMLQDYKEDIDEAWLHKDDSEGLTISFSAKLSVSKAGKHEGEVIMSFTKEKIKDKSTFNWDSQPGLFDQTKPADEKAEAPKGGNGHGESVAEI
jgi:hypothetical protein